MAESTGKSWETPVLTVLGDVETLTATGGAPIADGVGTLASTL